MKSFCYLLRNPDEIKKIENKLNIKILKPYSTLRKEAVYFNRETNKIIFCENGSFFHQESEKCESIDEFVSFYFTYLLLRE